MKRAVASCLLEALSAADDRIVASLFRTALGNRSIALCFHRVVTEARRSGELDAKLAMPEAEIDRLISFLLNAARRRGRWLTVCFDDGYRDAAEYILSRAPRFSDVEWIFFVCPAKIETQVGFRWDLAETQLAHGREQSIIHAPGDPETENLRADLRGLASDPRFALASIDLCRRLSALPNVQLGNHTNAHLRATMLGSDAFAAECARSDADFRRLFGGAPRHLAVPFGVPGVDFDARHVEPLRRVGRFEIWSTEPRPFDPGERGPSAVLPRFAVDGSRTWKQCAAHLALHALRARVAPRRFYFPAPQSSSIDEIDRGGNVNAVAEAAVRSSKPAAPAV
jgi:peptidoglycan/xylan/chitin deacetylase (PgdA/CDA1 family)